VFSRSRLAYVPLRLCIVLWEASISTSRPARVNERIRVPEVRLIDEEGEHIGVIRTRDALEMARERGYDLVEVQPNAAPPVCRLMDYGKFRYEEGRRERESRRRQRTAALKEVRLRPKIDDHDLDTKARQARKFLKSGSKVKLSVLFRGREIAHQDIGRTLLERIAEQLSDQSTIDQQPHMEGRSMVMLLSPTAEDKAADDAEAGAEQSTDD
jgi:translation initiation factor IF-3